MPRKDFPLQRADSDIRLNNRLWNSGTREVENGPRYTRIEVVVSAKRNGCGVHERTVVGDNRSWGVATREMTGKQGASLENLQGQDALSRRR